MLGFWLYMLAVDLLIPATMIGFGLLFLKRPPKKINAIFGYRSMRSMRNEDTWRFAHQHCGKVWCTAGLIMAPLSAIAVAFLYGLSTDRIGLFGGGLCLLQCIALLLSIFPTERALKRTFDSSGKRRESPCNEK